MPLCAIKKNALVEDAVAQLGQENDSQTCHVISAGRKTQAQENSLYFGKCVGVTAPSFVGIPAPCRLRACPISQWAGGAS